MRFRNTRNYFIALVLVTFIMNANAQVDMVDIHSRLLTRLDGHWNVILDPTGIGDWRQVWLEQKPEKKTDFIEYGFDGGPTLRVPGDFNSQMCELTYFEGTVWYRKQFEYIPKKDKRVFLRFGAVNYRADVYLNGKPIGSHEGGFTPFQFEITDHIEAGPNRIVVKVNNQRQHNGIPGTGYDWLNFGGITREVVIVETNDTYISDYSVQLKKGSLNTVLARVQLSGSRTSQSIVIRIPEAKVKYKARTDQNGLTDIEFKSAFELWSPENPKLYDVIIETERDTIRDQIGFRCIEVHGNGILLNKRPLFLKGVNIHEENPYTGSRAYSKEDALILLHAAKDLGCNIVRLAHYPHSENMVREAEKMGLLVWDELPVYQHISFSDSTVPVKMENMLKEMIRRDKNRCNVIIWSLSNETYPSTANRDNELIALTIKCRQMDSTRLITHVINTQHYLNHAFNVWDPLYHHSDLVAINEYLGWYIPWQGKPLATRWNLVCPDKPLVISEFGGEALYGNRSGAPDEAASWSEEYQADIYEKQIELFNTTPNLSGVFPWLLFDYRSPGRMHPVYQRGYNRKGLLSEKGEKKKAWQVMHNFFKTK